MIYQSFRIKKNDNKTQKQTRKHRQENPTQTPRGRIRKKEKKRKREKKSHTQTNLQAPIVTIGQYLSRNGSSSSRNHINICPRHFPPPDKLRCRPNHQTTTYSHHNYQLVESSFAQGVGGHSASMIALSPSPVSFVFRE